MYKEPWYDINDYSNEHKEALERELIKELTSVHALFDLNSNVIAKREDRDDILVLNEKGYYIVHLTWSGKPEIDSYPTSFYFETMEDLKTKLHSDSIEYKQ